MVRFCPALGRRARLTGFEGISPSITADFITADSTILALFTAYGLAVLAQTV